MRLVIGNKRYSSWSLRPWLLLKHNNIPFEETLIALDQSDTQQNILRYSPAARVPVLIDGKLTIWESIAIAEYLNEKFPEKKMWPEDAIQRAKARVYAAEMHSGFQTMRSLMPHDLHKQLKNFDASSAQSDINRIFEIWNECLKNSGGPFLFGSFCITDAMFAPVVNRFISYAIPVPESCRSYVETMRQLPAHQQWIREALEEKFTMPRYDK